MGRLLTLYLRSRHVPVALPAAIVAVAALAWLGNSPLNPFETVTWALLALGLGFGVLGNGLGAADRALERTGSIRWPVWRTVHVVLIGVVLFGTVALVSSAPVGLVLRDAAGFTGLAALGAAFFGSQLAWSLPIAWAGASIVLVQLARLPLLTVFVWPMQPANQGGAAVLAIVFGLVGVGWFALRG
ncbi:MAG TPA: hypothetical protein VJ914_23450 [Pseudonocardiaceae bacterium]|nr:hypothetical protein [Pseudonocardiaceae bacterium]